MRGDSSAGRVLCSGRSAAPPPGGIPMRPRHILALTAVALLATLLPARPADAQGTSGSLPGPMTSRQAGV